MFQTCWWCWYENAVYSKHLFKTRSRLVIIAIIFNSQNQHPVISPVQNCVSSQGQWRISAQLTKLKTQNWYIHTPYGDIKYKINPRTISKTCFTRLAERIREFKAANIEEFIIWRNNEVKCWKCMEFDTRSLCNMKARLMIIYKYWLYTSDGQEGINGTNFNLLYHLWWRNCFF